MKPHDDSLTAKQRARIERIRAERKTKATSLKNNPSLSDVTLTNVPISAVPLTNVPLSAVPLTNVPTSAVPLTNVPTSAVPLTNEPKKEIIMSVSIFGHGCEDYTSALRSDLANYFRNNVRVYSRACVPGTVSIGNILEYEGIIRDIRKRFSASGETDLIIEKYIDDLTPAYAQKVKSYLDRCKTDDTVCISKAKKAATEQRSSGLSTYLFEKEFGFYEESPDEKPSGPIKEKYPTLGVHVVNVSIKVTDVDGSVYYETVFDPSDDKYRRLDFTMFNLIYKDGLKQLLGELGKKTAFKDAQAALGFGRKNRVSELSLTQLYEFFKLMGVQYVNVMDFTCRSCALDMDQPILENIYRMEQDQNNAKRGLFGGKKSRKVKKSNYRKTYKRQI